MSTPTIDYDALAAQSGGTAQAAPVDYDALAAQHGGTASQPPAAQQPGFLDQVSAGLHSLTDNRDDEGALANAARHFAGNILSPVTAGVDMARGTPAQAAATGANAIAGTLGFASGQPPDLQGYAASGHPYANLAADAATAGLMAAGAAGGDAFPTRAKAGALFNEVRAAAGDQPVALTRTQPALERVAQLTDAGGPTLAAPNKLLLRSQTVNPISYNEARDFYSNISQLSAQDKMNLNGPMKAAVSELATAFKQDIGDTAEAAGKGQQYYDAMTQYRKAKVIQDVSATIGKYAAKGVGAAAGGAVLYPALQALIGLLR